LAVNFPRIDKGTVATYLKAARGRLRELLNAPLLIASPIERAAGSKSSDAPADRSGLSQAQAGGSGSDYRDIACSCAQH
jgi:hypothetical protein